MANLKPNSGYYNLDVIISVGYRVNSLRGTQFRIWANNVLKDYLLKGYALNNRMNRIEDHVDILTKRIDNIDLHIQSGEMSNQGIFFNGQVFDAYAFFSESHDRFIIIDNSELYHIGASLKDLGKKWFAFSRMDSMTGDLLKKLEE